MKRIGLVLSALLLALASTTTFAQGKGSQPIVTADYVSADGAYVAVRVIRHKDGSITGAGEWLYPDPENDFVIDVDQADISLDGTSAYLSGWVYFSGLSRRYVLKLIDNGEGHSATGPDMESYVWTFANPLRNLDYPNNFRPRLDNPGSFGLTSWFEIAAGNIQVHAGG
jgi:hypothetical protein